MAQRRNTRLFCLCRQRAKTKIWMVNLLCLRSYLPQEAPKLVYCPSLALNYILVSLAPAIPSFFWESAPKHSLSGSGCNGDCLLLDLSSAPNAGVLPPIEPTLKAYSTREFV